MPGILLELGAVGWSARAVRDSVDPVSDGETGVGSGEAVAVVGAAPALVAPAFVVDAFVVADTAIGDAATAITVAATIALRARTMVVISSP